MGRESGNPLVSEVANPTQARLYYSTIAEIRKRHYIGLVYNMTVANDNSYTVNGAVVHNCMCHYQYDMVSDPQIILDELRADVLRTRAELTDMIGPLMVERFTELLLSGRLDVLRAVTTIASGGVTV